MITTIETLLPGGERDSISLHCALFAAERERVAVFGALAALAGFEALQRDSGDLASAGVMAAASQWLDGERANLDKLIVDLALMGGIEVCRLAPQRDDRLKRETATREAAASLMKLTASFMRLAIAKVTIDRLEDAAAALGVSAIESEPGHAG